MRFRRFKARPRSAGYRRRRSGRVWPYILAASVLAAGVIGWSFLRGGGFLPGEGLAGSALSPGAGLFAKIGHGISRMWQGGEVAELEGRIAQLETQLAQSDQIAQENQRLQALLNAQPDFEPYETVSATVISRTDGRWYAQFVLNKGTLDGVCKDMAVVAPGGLVGRVVQVGPSVCEVISLIDSRSAVAGVVDRSRDEGVVRGNLDAGDDSDLCRMLYLPFGTDVLPGDRVVTSGLDGIYPKGLVIGTVAQTVNQKDTQQSYVTIAPAVDFQHLENVLILKYQSPDTSGLDDDA
ncbi:MAG: rod shape-determining protein MreC [Christensenellales bacterium]|jgi:rod shape-determining protein MreC